MASLRHLRELAAGVTTLLSIDADFFRLGDEQDVLDELGIWLRSASERGVPIVFCRDHVVLERNWAGHYPLAINVDFHMVLTMEYLFGDPAHSPAQDATVFESPLSSRRLERYVWAFPLARRQDAATAYAAALVRDRQPALARVHCAPAREVIAELLPVVVVDSVFLCRSPRYATRQSDAALRSLLSSIAPGSGRP